MRLPCRFFILILTHPHNSYNDKCTEDTKMPVIHKISELELTQNKSPIPHFSWKASASLEEITGSKYLLFDIKSLDPGKFSYPYHFHRNAEELFIILEGTATLRSPNGFETLTKGDMIFFEEGSSGAHQLYNHSDQPFIYVDLGSKANIDVCEYPDSGKVNILPNRDIFMQAAKVPYYTGEENVQDKWPEGLDKRS